MSAVHNLSDFVPGLSQVVDELESEIAGRSTSASGVYTPTASGAINLDASPTMTQAQYLQVGDVVTVSGLFTADPTAAGTARFDITLPVASNLGAAEDLAGVAFGGGVAGLGAQVVGAAAGNAARFLWVAVDLTSQQFSYTFTYRVI